MLGDAGHLPLFAQPIAPFDDAMHRKEAECSVKQQNARPQRIVAKSFCHRMLRGQPLRWGFYFSAQTAKVRARIRRVVTLAERWRPYALGGSPWVILFPAQTTKVRRNF
jgi:hypothetical protein